MFMLNRLLFPFLNWKFSFKSFIGPEYKQNSLSIIIIIFYVLTIKQPEYIFSVYILLAH